MTDAHTTCAAVVVRPQLSWFASPGEDARFGTTPDWARVEVARVVLAAQTLWFRRRAEGTVLWQCPENVDMRRVLAELRGRDCKVSDSGLETGWFTITHEGWPIVHLGVASLIRKHLTPIASLYDEAKLIAERFARYADLTGAAWRGTAGLAGSAAIRTMREEARGGEPLWRWDRGAALDETGCSFELRGSKHCRALVGAEYSMQYVHQFDIRAQYLAAANVAMLAWSGPEPSGPREFDPGRAGYWTVRRDQLDDAPATLVRGGTSRLVTVTTPVLAYLYERGIRPEVMDSVTADRTGRYLRPWAERLTAAQRSLRKRSKVDDGVGPAIKATYSQTIGLMARVGGRIYRPDWRDTGVDTARVNVLRKTDAADIDPVRFNVDAVWVVTDKPADEILRQLGTPFVDGKAVEQVGKFRHVDTYTVAEYLASHPMPVTV